MRKTLAFRPAPQFEVTLGSASEAFRLRCQAQQLSPGTLGWYKQLLKMFGVFLEEHGVSTVREVTPTLLRQLLEAMRGRGNSTVTVEHAYGGLRCFFGFLRKFSPMDPIGHNPRRPAARSRAIAGRLDFRLLILAQLSSME